MSNRQPAYRMMYADWVPGLLRDALVHESGLLRNPAQAEWVVKVHTMADMTSLPLDYGLISAVAENLYNSQWPVRLMAVYLLAGNPENGFEKVLNWVAKEDSNEFVRNMAIMLSEPSSGSKSAF